MIDHCETFSLGRKVKLIDGKKTRIAVLDDHPVVALGTTALLNAQPDMTVLAHCSRGDDLEQLLKQTPCDLAVLDYYLAQQPIDGVNLIRRLQLRYPKLLLVVHSGGDAHELEFVVYRAGASGFLGKREKLGLLVDLVRCVRQQPRAFFALRDGLLSPVIPTRGEQELTVGEIEVLRQLACGHTVAQVARLVHRSKQTISSHKRSAMAKLHLNDDLALALYLREKYSD